MEKKKKAIGLMLITTHRHKNYLEAKLTENGLDIYPAQHRILININNVPGISQKELARVLQVSPATITISVKKLIRSGYVVKTNSDEDNRCNILTITDKGKEIVDKSGAIFDSIDDDMFEGFTDGEIDSVIHYMERILRNIDRVHPHDNICECMPCDINKDIVDTKKEQEEG